MLFFLKYKYAYEIKVKLRKYHKNSFQQNITFDKKKLKILIIIIWRYNFFIQKP